MNAKSVAHLEIPKLICMASENLWTASTNLHRLSSFWAKSCPYILNGIKTYQNSPYNYQADLTNDSMGLEQGKIVKD